MSIYNWNGYVEIPHKDTMRLFLEQWWETGRTLIAWNSENEGHAKDVDEALSKRKDNRIEACFIVGGPYSDGSQLWRRTGNFFKNFCIHNVKDGTAVLHLECANADVAGGIKYEAVYDNGDYREAFLNYGEDLRFDYCDECWDSIKDEFSEEDESTLFETNSDRLKNFDANFQPVCEKCGKEFLEIEDKDGFEDTGWFMYRNHETVDYLNVNPNSNHN